jgi:hypothetical protein
VNVAHYEGDRFFNRAASIGFSAKSIDAERAPARGKIRGGYGLNCFGGHKLIIAAASRDESSRLAKEHLLRMANQPRALKGKMASCFEGIGTPLCVAG